LALVIPGEAGSFWFASHIAPGRTRSDVETLRKETFGSSGGTLNSTLHDSADPTPDVSHVWFSTGGVPCAEWGRIYRLEFDGENRLRSWARGDFGDGC
jgi:hypothetical protein